MVVKDDLEQKQVKLSGEELDIIKRLQEGLFPESGYDPYEVARPLLVVSSRDDGFALASRKWSGSAARRKSTRWRYGPSC